jgi:biopolymer transport protein ExbD
MPISPAGRLITLGAEKLTTGKRDQITDTNMINPDLSVVVKGADNVDYQNMISVLDVLQQLDISKVGLATEANQ